MTAEQIAEWAKTHLHDPDDIDCVITLMLKILDGKCRMRDADKHTAVALYDAVGQRPAKRLARDCHALIAKARQQDDDALRMAIYETRLLAETMLSRPVMKAFKARLRSAGILQADDNGDGRTD